jgi:hypothetical protein
MFSGKLTSRILRPKNKQYNWLEEARIWYDDGDAYARASGWIADTAVDRNDIRVFAGPVLVMMAFATELYLKSIIAYETQKPPPMTHDLYGLYLRVSIERRERAQNHLVRDPRVFESNPGVDPNEITIASLLRASAGAFVRIRYREDITWTASGVTWALRAVIHEDYPEWNPE